MKIFRVATIVFLNCLMIDTLFALGSKDGTSVPLNFFTESAETLDPKDYVFYFDIFAIDYIDSKDTFIQMPETYLYYGVADNLTIYGLGRMSYNKAQGESSQYGLGDTDLGIEYRFYHSDEKKIDLSFFPIVTIPTGNENRGLGNGTVWSQWPLWLQKRWNDWAVYAGGGYAFNYAKSESNFPFGGLTIQKDYASQNFGVAAEIWSQGATGEDYAGFTILDASFGYDITQHFAAVLTLGQSIAGADNRIGYLSLYWEGKL
jgi:hypothetical protein